MTPSNSALALRPIHLPDPISWWPPALGWFILLGLLIVVIGVLAFWYFKRKYNQNTLIIQQALHELDQLVEYFEHDKRQLVQQLSALIRRVAMQFYGRDNTASLAGQSWAEFLQSSGKQGMSADLAQALSEMPYRPIEDVNTEQLVLQIRQWISAQTKPHYRKPQHV